MREGNSKALILKLLRAAGTCSRADLAKLSGMTKPSISTIILTLMQEGLVEELGKGKSTGGKCPIMLRINPIGRFAVGIDIADESNVRAVACGLDGVIVAKTAVPYKDNAAGLAHAAKSAFDEVMTRINRPKLAGVGVAISGIVDPALNEVILSANKGFSKLLAESLGCEPLLVNRQHAAALAERKFGAGRRFENFLQINVGKGVGSGIILKGEIFTGSKGASGEIGDLWISGGANRPASRLADFLHSLPNTHSSMEPMASALASAATAMSDILDPQAIILGGRPVDFGQPFLDAFTAHFRDNRYAAVDSKPEILFSEFIRDGSAMGGAALVLNKVLRRETPGE